MRRRGIAASSRDQQGEHAGDSEWSTAGSGARGKMTYMIAHDSRQWDRSKNCRTRAMVPAAYCRRGELT